MKIIDERQKVKNRAILFLKNLEYKTEVYILGTNLYGAVTAKWLLQLGYTVGGFINDFETNTKFKNFKVFKSIELPTHIFVINCIVEGRVIIAEQNIKKLNLISHIDYFALQLAFPDDLIEINFLNDTSSILKNADEYLILYKFLADIESKETLKKIVNFRLNRDIKNLEYFQYRIDKQYFEPFTQLNNEPSFIDGGGFDGETSINFAKLYPNYKNIYYFEPNKAALLASQEKLDNLSNIHYFQKGLWSKTDYLLFNSTLGSASKLTSQGNIKIETTSIDELINSKIDFIKLDIEGAEYDALIGAKQLICKYKPLLAICVYHNQTDFIRIPKLLLSYNKNYKIYLRHYTQGVFETVMYFV